jgi:hypothetical protein
MKATKQEIKKIKKLLKQLGANSSLRKNVFDILTYHSSTLEIYANTIINGLSLGLELKNNSKSIAFISPMQSGKSGSVFFLNYVLPEIGFLQEGENVLFLTSMRDIDLYKQNIKNLHKEYYDCNINGHKDSKIFVYKIDEIFKYPNPFEIVDSLNIKLFVRDELQYGAGEESTFDSGFFHELRKQLPEMPLISVSATPYDLLDAKLKGIPVAVVKGEVPDNYMGIPKMLKLGLIEDYDPSFSPCIDFTDSNGNTIYQISSKFDEYMQHLLKFSDGFGMIRLPKSEDAFILRKVARNKYNNQITTIVIGSDSLCDHSISDGIDELKILVNSQKKRVLLIVVQALSAGKDLGTLKEKIRFGIETRRSQLANGAQGIPGRMCGYHNNTTFKLMASLTLLEKYAEFEEDWEIFNDEAWRNELMLGGVGSLTTQVDFAATQRAKTFTPIAEDPIKIEYNEIITTSGRNKLHFLDDHAYNQLLTAFEENVWKIDSKKYRLKSKKSNTTIRLASGYNCNDNRVYKLWNKYKTGADFGDVMFKKKGYDYGILISNIPLGEIGYNNNTNEIGFCGVEIYKAGRETSQGSITSTNNHSMYNK